MAEGKQMDQKDPDFTFPTNYQVAVTFELFAQLVPDVPADQWERMPLEERVDLVEKSRTT